MNAPEWVTKDGVIDEPSFCYYFLSQHPMKCIDGIFYTVDGVYDDLNELKKQIYEEICLYVKVRVSKKVDDILNTLKLIAYSKPIPLHTDRIHLINGTLFLNGTFVPVKEYCRNRLNINYTKNTEAPMYWLKFLNELLNEEDIITLQEYLGYCLIPTTKGQKMMIIIGKGGEGKSRIGYVMARILDKSLITNSINKIETNRFSRADLENVLLMVDDDLDMNALPKTNYLKSIVTAESKIDVERKSIQSYQSLLYARFLCFGNGALTSLHDRSVGFFRRQIVLLTKDKPADRIDDPFLLEKLFNEIDGIFTWCFEGLQRLIQNNYRFTISTSASDYIDMTAKKSNNVISFLSSVGYIELIPDGKATTKELYDAYQQWCNDNLEIILKANTFSEELGKCEESYHIKKTNNIYTHQGKRVRGFEGIRCL